MSAIVSTRTAPSRSLLPILTGIALATVAASCTWANQAQPWVHAGPRSLTVLPDWAHESTAGLRQALLAQCRVAPRLGAPWPALCAELSALAPGQDDSDPALRDWISQRFDAWAVTAPNGAARGLLTGYFEPVVTGSRQRESAEQTPLYAPPVGRDPARPFAPRAQIARLQASAEAAGELPASDRPDGAPDPVLDPIATALQGRELVWLDDPIDAFFLQIQGSGRVQLRDGSEMRVGYAGNNGHKYFAIGRALIDRGAISRAEMSAQAIRHWLATHPDQAQAVMNLNPRYIFFRELPAPKATFGSEQQAQAVAAPGPIGSLGVALTPGRSLATDPAFLPAGTLVYLATRPNTDNGTANPMLGRLAVSQDTGSAIRGAVRADLFTGTGAAAGAQAGTLRDPLQIWLLWPRGVRPAGKLPFARVDLDD